MTPSAQADSPNQPDTPTAMHTCRTIENLAHAVHTRAAATRQHAALVVFISGIDASGKGFVTQRLAAGLTSLGHAVALVGIDPWLNPPALRELPPTSPQRGTHFYHHAFNFDRLFSLLIEPLARDGRIDLVVPLGGQSGNVTNHRYAFAHVNVLLVEGIFLLRPRLAPRADLRVWVECSFETALARALTRNQEGLSEHEIRRDYEEMYFAAQRHHLATDNPRERADILYLNDDRPFGPR